MQKFQIVMCIYLLAFTLTGCTQSKGLNSTSTKVSSSSLASKASEEPGSSTMVSIPTSTPDSSSTNNKSNLEPASATEPSINLSAWFGKWKWDQSTQYDVSTITINNIKDQQVFFSLNAFHVTNHDTMDGHNGEIEDGIAIFNGKEAVYKDTEFDFELRMSFEKDHLEVKTNNSNIFGASVVVDGLYNRDQTDPISNNEHLIIPGKSVGKISLGMTREDVIKLLGNPIDSYNDKITYRSKKDYFSVYLKNSIVKQIEFSSPSFETKEGFNTINIGDSHDKFIESEFQWRFLQLRFDWDKGGLSFFTFNADLPDDNTEYSRYTSGYVYEGQQMYQGPISHAKWKPVQQNDDSSSNTKDVTSLIPVGWHILDVNYENAKAKAEGDLNKDGIEDIAIVIEKDSDMDARSLLIAFGTKDNTYSLSIIANNVILGALDGGGWGDPFDGIVIDRGSVVVNDYGGSGQRWYDNYRFRFQENDWYLIGATMGWNHPIKEGTEMTFDEEDYNLLTGDYVFDKTSEDGEEKITKGNRGKKKLVKLSEFNIDDM